MTDITQFPDLGARLSQKIIGAGIVVHQALGPGLLENVYEECMAIQMKKDGLAFERQKEIPIVYDGVKLDLRYKADFIVENESGNLLGIEVKAGTSVDLADFKHLKWFKENIKLGRKNFTGIVLYTGVHLVSFGAGLWAVPISVLF